MNTKQTAYETASSHSFTLQTKRVEVPVSDCKPTVIQIGIQPFGITSSPFGNVGDVVAIANYLAPAQHIGKVTVSNGMLTREFKRVAGAMNGISWCRGGFPEMDTVAKANRCWTAVLGSPTNGELLVGRGDPEFFRLIPQGEEERHWSVTERIVLPRPYGSYPFMFVASATLLNNSRFLTVEHDGEYTCEAVEWEIGGDKCKRVITHPLGKFRYGIAVAQLEDGREKLVTITSHHATDPVGIYMGDACIVPEVFGDGICPLVGGGALVTRRGMESPVGDSLEVPGALIYIPPALFPPGMKWVR